ncbi:hypothetical protein RZE82_06720 [Mollicutes bacterium LVI A0039]|nr:hypothetical protein RZE82_06720 [Mollicutes bacterium LVI A0039]
MKQKLSVIQKFVEFSVDNFEMCINEALNEPVGKITKIDMLELSELYCYSAGVSSISETITIEPSIKSNF